MVCRLDIRLRKVRVAVYCCRACHIKRQAVQPQVARIQTLYTVMRWNGRQYLAYHSEKNLAEFEIMLNFVCLQRQTFLLELKDFYQCLLENIFLNNSQQPSGLGNEPDEIEQLLRISDILNTHYCRRLRELFLVRIVAKLDSLQTESINF